MRNVPDVKHCWMTIYRAHITPSLFCIQSCRWSRCTGSWHHLPVWWTSVCCLGSGTCSSIRGLWCFSRSHLACSRSRFLYHPLLDSFISLLFDIPVIFNNFSHLFLPSKHIVVIVVSIHHNTFPLLLLPKTPSLFTPSPQEEELVSSENSASIFNTLSDLPSQLKNGPAVLGEAMRLAGTLSQETLVAHRHKHLAYILNEQAQLNNGIHTTLNTNLNKVSPSSQRKSMSLKCHDPPLFLSESKPAVILFFMGVPHQAYCLIVGLILYHLYVFRWWGDSRCAGSPPWAPCCLGRMRQRLSSPRT